MSMDEVRNPVPPLRRFKISAFILLIRGESSQLHNLKFLWNFLILKKNNQDFREIKLNGFPMKKLSTTESLERYELR